MTWSARMRTGIRYLLVTGVLLGAVGAAGYFANWPLLTATLGPTAYVFAAHPHTEVAHLRNAILGHAVAIMVGLATVAAFGLWHHGPISGTAGPAPVQVGATVVAAGITLLVLELAKSHHSPAAATALLIATGMARPGKPLLGLVVGLAIVLIFGPLTGRLARPQARRPDKATELPRTAKVLQVMP